MTPADVGTSEKAFSPHILVVPVGSTVSVPNHDPFNHNVFSLSEDNPFDLGLYGRGETRSVRFAKAGVVRVYCNIHAQMSAFVVVRDTPWFAQPGSDGSFTLDGVPAGRYVLHASHERAPRGSPAPSSEPWPGGRRTAGQQPAKCCTPWRRSEPQPASGETPESGAGAPIVTS